MDLRLRGKKVLITGGSKGIGLAIAKEFASEGCNIALVSRSNDELQNVKSQLENEYKVQVEILAIDLTQKDAAKALTKNFPQTDVLINNAGAIPAGNIEEIDEEKWRAAWDLKIFGYINNTREFYKLMKAQGRGVIINIIGIGGERLDAGYIAGSVGNAALIAMTKALGSVSIDSGIRILGVNPGPVSTERLEFLARKKAVVQFGDENRWEEFQKEMPLSRAAKTTEVAPTVVFLASDLCSYTSGTVINIDGGITSRNAKR
jgi:NAD(P)-dependent dehydrogenase (short-subunit alcohol dehydrogenase family)